MLCPKIVHSSPRERVIRMRILVVDDNKAYLNLIGDLLEESGYEVFPVEDGKQAREFLEDHGVDVIISDVFMPTLDGSRLHSYVREFSGSGNVPFIFVSGFDDERTRSLIQDPRIDFFISKTAPVANIVNLIKRVKEGLEAQQNQRGTSDDRAGAKRDTGTG